MVNCESNLLCEPRNIRLETSAYTQTYITYYPFCEIIPKEKVC